MKVLDQLSWSPWYELRGASQNPEIPHHKGGLYRIRERGSRILYYIGQTGSSSRGLRGRMSNLQGAFKDHMPYRDPHTAAPALWVQFHLGHILEVSICVIDSDTQWRKGLEAVAISCYRQDHQSSPIFNFGRMPLGYEMPSGNNSKLKASGKLSRGVKTAQRLTCHMSGRSPLGGLDHIVTDSAWCGHCWTSWCSAEGINELSNEAKGLYRIKAIDDESLLYIGEGKIKSRLKAHLDKINRPEDVQGQIFARSELQFSWVYTGEWKEHKHQRLELENDLIAAHLLSRGSVPAAQFLGS